MDKNFRIVFMGTPGFAVASLDALVKSGANVVAVVTAPDKPAGRGLNLKEPEVKQYAVANNIPVLQPEKLKSPEFIATLQNLEPDLAVVVAFRMLPEVIWSMPTKGTINVHASLLPQYRGAAPINWAIINGELKTGVTTFFIEKEIDTGKIIASREVEILNEDTAGTLHDKLAAVGADLLVETVESIRNDTCSPVSQNSFPASSLKPAPKIFRDDCRINWHKPVNEVYNFVRGLSPYPGAWTVLNMGNESKTFKILACKPIASTNDSPGKIWSERSDLFISGVHGRFQILQLQLEGKKPMKADEFIRGARNLNLFSIES